MKRPRYLNFWLFMAALVVAGGIALAASFSVARSFLIGFDLGAVAFITGTLHMMRAGDPETMRVRAKANDPDHYVLLLVVLLMVVVVLVAVWVELTGSGGGKGTAVAVSGATLLLAWLFSNLMFALHYAHKFYSPGDDDETDSSRGDGDDRDSGGLDFPSDDLPDYGDFAYFSFVLGMTFQVSDVEITSKPIRRLALYHSLAAFLFNIVVVALSVSLIGNLLQKN